jgi:hypothetical protein
VRVILKTRAHARARRSSVRRLSVPPLESFPLFEKFPLVEKSPPFGVVTEP